MTNLSIIGRLNALALEGRLFCYAPELIQVPQGRRYIWLTAEAKQWRDGADKSLTEAAFFMALQQLDNFHYGFELIEDEDLKRLENCDQNDQEVWAIRSLLKPQVRLFGWFPCPMHFVVVHVKRRDKLPTDKWRKAIKKVVLARSAMNLPCFEGETFSEYVG